MQFVGAYITYSELFDRKPSWDEIVSLVKEVPMLDALLMLSRINLSPRYALQEHNRPNFGRVQQHLVGNFSDDTWFKRMQERFAQVSTERRPVFLPVGVLNVARLVLAHSQKGHPPSSDDNPALRYSLGTAFLMMNDLLLSAEEERQITVGDEEGRRLALLVQMLAPFELANPPAAHHLLFRYQVMFRTLLGQRAVRDRIATQCRKFDFHTEFRRLANIPLERWLHIVFSVYAYYLQGGNLFDPHPEHFFIDPKTFIAQSKVTEDELNAVLETIAGTISGLHAEITKEKDTDPRFDFVPFRSRPLFEAEENRFACLDLALLLEKLHTGVHWVMHDAYLQSPARRDDLFQAWGVLFEEYVHWLLEGMETKLSIKYFRSPQWQEGGESFDGILLQDGVLAPLEYKGGFLLRNARYSGKTEEFIKDCEAKFAVGCQQLASKINALFTAKNSERKHIAELPLNQVRAIIPVLVLQDHILRVPFLNWYLNKRFQEELKMYSLRPGILVRPLSVVNIHEFETMVSSAEASGFDFIYGLHHRAVRDEEMLSGLQEFLMQFPTYGRQQSARAKKVYDELHGHMFSYLFPYEVKQGGGELS